ncbi:MAG: ferrous iron transport protein A [Candidatus Omnitrophica bacterium]|nr:ferrous iron transport protein A [Candidatus Omnitrophota bacterium]MBU1932468.1 ferrous iron transport protein A [Candidatus Omnitrophota bacterium]
MIVDLTQMRTGESGIIKELRGGCGFERRINSMGLRPGKQIKKVSSHFWRGPQTVEVDRVCFSIGFGMAKKISIEVKGENK